MQPHEMNALDPYYAAARGSAEFTARDNLYQALEYFDTVLDARGQAIMSANLGGFLNLPKVLELLSFEKCDEDELFLRAWILPAHDHFEQPSLTGTGDWPSRFLVVDSRYPSQDNDEPWPQYHLRSYFLLIGGRNLYLTDEDIDLGLVNFPYFIVSERRVSDEGVSELLREPHVYHEFFENDTPLRLSTPPIQLVRHEEPYAALDQEVRRAIQNLG